MGNVLNSSGFYTVQYEPFITNFVRNLYYKFGQRFDYDDMLSVATIASLEAEDRYDPDVGSFSSFVRKPIEGAVIRSISTTSSKQQSLLIKVFSYIDKYAYEHEEIPDIVMVLAELKIKPEDYERALSASDTIHVVPMEDAYTQESDNHEFEDLYDGIDRLPEKYRIVVERFMDDKPYSQAMLTTAIQKLKQIMEV